jgi:hypothetical protein
MLQTTTDAPKARSFFLKHHPRLGNRTAHRRYGRACEARRRWLFSSSEEC